jgi:ArsR family transcriptional regulator, arsenate/arsenite/antimonite-responsive transcriptional repressor
MIAMAQKKADLFANDDIQIAAFAKALAHPARVVILRLLAERSLCICNDFVEELPLAQATVSQHLRELKDAGLIVGEEQGTKVCYCLSSTAIGTLSALVGGFVSDLHAAPQNNRAKHKQHEQPCEC